MGFRNGRDWKCAKDFWIVGTMSKADVVVACSHWPITFFQTAVENNNGVEGETVLQTGVWRSNCMYE